MRTIFTYCLLLAFIFLPCLASAEENTVNMEEVTVTATRYQEQPSEVPAYVTIITAEDISNSPAQNIPELLRTETGIQVNDISGNHRNYTVDLRGFGETASSNTLVLVDGRRINQADLSGTDWTEIPLERVERIEIIRGGRGSVLYGDNATGGVINIITKLGGNLKGSGELAGGSYKTFKSTANVSGSLKDLSLSLTGKYLTSDGYRENSGTDAKDFGMNTNYTLKDIFRLNASGGYHRDNTGLPGALFESDFKKGVTRTESLHPNDYADVEDYYFKLVPEVSFLDSSFFKVDTSFRKRSFSSFASGTFGHFSGDSDIKTVIVSPQIVLKNAVGNAANTLTAGMDYVKADDDIVNRSVFYGIPSTGIFDLHKENYGYYLHDEINIGDKLFLSGGYRYDKARFSFNPSTPEDRDMHENLFTAGANYTFYGKSYVYFSFSRSFRYPLLDELYNFFNNTINISLKPQSSDDCEIGIRYYFGSDIYANLNLFRINTYDEIFFNPQTYANENLDGTARRQGVEISFSIKPVDWLTFKTGYAYVHANIKGGTFNGKDVPNVPKHKAFGSIVTSLGKGFTAALNGVYVGKRPFISDFSNEFSEQKSYLAFNTKLQYQWKALNVFLAVNNITNTKYSEFGVIGVNSSGELERSFYPSQRLNVLAGVTVSI